MAFRKSFFTLACFAGILAASACNLPSAQQIVEDAQPVDLNAILTEIAVETQVASLPTSTPEPTAPIPTPTTEPGKILTVCLGKEPQTLFFYNESSQAMWSVLESIYDGPFDTLNGKSEPVIFESVDVKKEPVEVVKDDIVMDADGEIVAIKSGIVINPSNYAATCGTENCELTWQNALVDVEMSQVTITFKLKSGLLWSDGEPLTAEDSVYSMNVNGMKEIKSSKKELNLTESYEAEDETTIVWKGIPGYIPEEAADVFWIPLPKHLLDGMSATELLASESVNRTPTGWGAYQIASWDAGSEIRAIRNPYYSAADGSQPWFDQIVYKFYGSAGDNNMEALKSGTCDIIDTSVDLESNIEPILEDVRDGKLSIYVRPETTWQQLTFGINSLLEDRPSGYSDFFTSVDVRKGLQQCINRKQIIRDVFYGQAEEALGFYPAGYMYNDSAIEETAYDPEAGAAALDAAGWKDLDEDPATPRTAESVAGVTYGTPFAVDLTVSDSEVSQKVAKMVKSDLVKCGVEVTVVPEKLAQFFGQGPDGTLFGRKFDLASFAWSSGLRSPCTLYTTEQIPTTENNWIGVNVGGFSSTDYDVLCQAAVSADPFAETSMEKYTAVQEAYASMLPVIPLYFDFSVGASANGICGLEDTIGSRSLLWNIEKLSRSDDVCAVSQWTNIYE